MEKKVLVILGHSSTNSLCNGLADAYAKGAKSSGATIKRLNICDLKFDPILHEGYNKRQKLEPDLVKAQELIKWSEHIVLVFPTWWGTMPALLKGFFDRVMLPGFAFNFKKDSLFWIKHLKGRTAHLIVTMGGYPLYYSLAWHSPGINAIKKATLGFSGIKVKHVTTIGGVKQPSEDKIKKWVAMARKKGERLL